MVVVASLDIGGTTLKGGVVDGSVILAERRWPTPVHRGAVAVVDAVVDAADELCAVCESVTGRAPEVVGLASLGLVDVDAGVAVQSSTLGWSDVPLVRLVRERVGVPVVLSHDIGAAAVAELALLDVDEQTNVVFVAIGTGIGATAVVNGQPVRGAHRRAGEIGHLPVADGVLRCGCGRQGCLETVASGRAIGAAYLTLSGATGPVTAQDVAHAAASGDVVAIGVWQRATRALAEALATYSMLIDPSAIILGGGLSLAGEQLIGPVVAGLPAYLPFAGVPRVVVAQYADRAAMLGAAMLAADAVSNPCDVPEYT